MFNFNRNQSCVVYIMLFLSLSFFGCRQDEGGRTQSSSSGDSSSPVVAGETVSFNFDFTSTVRNLSDSSQAERFTTGQIMYGYLYVENQDEGTMESYSWTVYLDDDTWEVESNRTLVLSPANYTFTLKLTLGERVYLGTNAIYIGEGTNQVPITIIPQIGEVITTIDPYTIPDPNAYITFHYGPEELQDITTPKLRIFVDSSTVYQELVLNKTTGDSTTYAAIEEGSYVIKLELYDGSTLVGRSVPEQENQDIVFGQNNTMDLVPLYGETEVVLAEDGGDALFSFVIPHEIVDEAGSLDNLRGVFEIVGPKNLPMRTLELSIETFGDDYSAEVILDNYQYDVVDYTITFYNIAEDVEISHCNVADVYLNKDLQTKPCQVEVLRYSVTDGNILAVVGFNVLSDHGEPVIGASIFANDELIGLTGDGTFGTSGYLLKRLLGGEYSIRAEFGESSVETTLSLNPLDVENLELVLDINEISWNFVDGGSTAGLNNNASKNATESTMVTLNDQLYTAWQENNGTNLQIRVAKYDGATWSFIDGGGTNGINKNPAYHALYPDLQVHKGQLFATWEEFYNSSNYGQIRVAKYNGTTWSFIDGDQGLNKVSPGYAQKPKLVSFGENLYAVWYEYIGSVYQIRVAAYNGASWNFVDGNGTSGINYNTSKHGKVPHPIVWNGQLVISWHELNTTTNYYQIRVKSYDGTAWSFIDGGEASGISKDLSTHAYYPNLISFNSKLYLTWRQSQGSINQIRVASYDGSSWSYVDGNGTYGINKTPTRPADFPKLQVYKNQLYSTWHEHNGYQYQIRVAAYDGNSTWTFPGNSGGSIGINKNPNQHAYNPSLIPFNNRLYSTWHEHNGSTQQIRVVRGDH